eukprot:Gb_40464 [translate_table: standard]
MDIAIEETVLVLRRGCKETYALHDIWLGADGQLKVGTGVGISLQWLHFDEIMLEMLLCYAIRLIATASIFLAAKSEETPRPLNSVLIVSYEICHKHDFTSFHQSLPIYWFEQYKEQVLEAEQMILTTLDFELTVQHPYNPLMSVLNKIGLAQTVLVHVAWNLSAQCSALSAHPYCIPVCYKLQISARALLLNMLTPASSFYVNCKLFPSALTVYASSI